MAFKVVFLPTGNSRSQKKRQRAVNKRPYALLIGAVARKKTNIPIQGDGFDEVHAQKGRANRCGSNRRADRHSGDLASIRGEIGVSIS
ncbi:MAG TPA: hypothetical protein VJS30_13600 [Paraburkholderia sp.]|nr:hypothetical protein [Paraburkholderia sp.]